MEGLGRAVTHLFRRVESRFAESGRGREEAGVAGSGGGDGAEHDGGWCWYLVGLVWFDCVCWVDLVDELKMELM
jgi:hypothetical protein